MKHEILWLPDVEEHDYPAAFDYLSNHFSDERAAALVDLLRNAPVIKKKAKDLFRASGLTLLGADNRHVEHNRKKYEAGKPLSPILIVRGEPAIIADGFHRLSFAYLFDEDAEVPCKSVCR